MPRIPDRITLYRRTRSGVNAYELRIVPSGKGFVVEVARGPLAGPLKRSARPSKPLSRDNAQFLFADLIMSRYGQGYRKEKPDGDAPPPKPRPKPPTKPTWRHPDLGRFQYDGDAWVTTVTVPAFKAFTFGGAAAKRTLKFGADEATHTPAPAMVALAAKVITNADALVRKIAIALWDDFTGRGPDSGMFWHGDLTAVTEAIAEDDPTLAAPGGADDLFRLIGLPDLIVHQSVFYYDKPVVEVSFAAAFDAEHGLSVLTDGRRILGIGRASDVTPFKTFRTPKRRKASRTDSTSPHPKGARRSR